MEKHGLIEEYELMLLRHRRNQLLDSTDKYLMPDFPISSNNLKLIKEYRQQLRDYMKDRKSVV